MVDRACKLFRDGKREEVEALTNEIRDEISKTIILNDETWEGLRCRICPSCATAIPTCFCVCLECEVQLISTGRFCVNIDSDDDDDDHKPNVSGDARRAQEEANLRMFGQGPTGRSGSAPNTFVIWRSNVRGCTFSTNCGLRQGSSTSPRMR